MVGGGIFTPVVCWSIYVGKKYFFCAQQLVAQIIYHRLGQGQVTFNIIVLILLFAPSTFIHLETLVSIYDLIPLSICIKPNSITVPDLCVSWRNINEIRRYVHIFSKGWFFHIILWVLNFVIFFLLVYFMAYLWEASKYLFILCYWYHHSLYIYFVTSATRSWDHLPLASCWWYLKL